MRKKKGKKKYKKGYNTILKSNTTYKYYYGEDYIKSIIREKSVKRRPIIAKKLRQATASTMASAACFLAVVACALLASNNCHAALRLADATAAPAAAGAVPGLPAVPTLPMVLKCIEL
jgi:hypothetical protein